MTAGRLLILDDDPAIGQTMRFIAEGVGMEVSYTDSPVRFFELVESWQPSHIALDLVMPDMDGVEVLVQLARRACRACIIISSGVGGRVLDAAGRSAAEHGLEIAGVLPKPFSPSALRGLLSHTPRAADGQRQQTAQGAASPFEVTATDLQRALDQQELQLVYQPKVDCVSGVLAGFEALARWVHPEFGVIMPDRFVPLAEKHGMIDTLTQCVLERALEWYGGPGRGDMQAAGAPDATLSMNISARTLKDIRFVDRIDARCRELGVDPERLVFELTETSAMEDPVTSLGLLTRLRMKGFQLSIDDFGTGYSSMLQLVRLPFSEIKVDKSFVMTALRSEESRVVVKTVVDLGHSLGLCATAEGVENAQTLQYLRDIGCDLAQGYFIGRPMPPDAIARWIAER